MADERLPVQLATRGLAVSESGFYDWKTRPPSVRSVRHAGLTESIRAVHVASRGIYGARRVHAELTLGQGLLVSHGTVELLMKTAGLQGLSGRRRWRRIVPDSIATDLVGRQFGRSQPNSLWVTDITEHRTIEGKVYCAVVLDTYSRRVVGWSIDASPTGALVTNALSMAIERRKPPAGTVIHSDQGVQFGSWVFTQRAKESGLLPSMGSIGDCYDNSMIEAFWSRLQVELLDRRRWRTRLELSNALFDYLEIWHNRQRRHSQLGMLTPLEFEDQNKIIVA